jgi:tetratricopeptide (TPR) repeat protein
MTADLDLAGTVADAYGLWRAGAHLAAEDICRDILAAAPDTPAALYLLGVAALDRGETDAGMALLRQAGASPRATPGFLIDLAERERRTGRSAEAEALARRALAADPCLAPAWNLLAALRLDRGEIQDGELCLTRALALDPGLAEALLNRGQALRRQGLPAEAAAFYRAAIERQPGLASAHVDLAGALEALGEWPEALAHAARAIDLAPLTAAAYATAASIAGRMGTPDQAEAWIAQGLEAVPDDPILRTAEANLLLDRGRIDAAGRAFARALAQAPDHAPALHGQAAIAHFRRQEPDIAALERRLAQDGATSDSRTSDDDRVQLHFALGRAYLDRDEPERGFGHFAAGNGLRRAGYAYDVGDDERLMVAIAAAFPAEAIAGAAGDPDERPLFIVGMPRSGTSLLEQRLAAHPAIHGAGELLELKHLVIRRLDRFPDVAGGPFPALGRQYVEAVAQLAPDARRIIDKLPLNFYFAGLIHLMLPNARILHIRRDPLDTCLSCHTTLFREPMRFVHDQAELGRFHRAYRRLMDHWRQVLPPDRFTEIEYDRLVSEPEAETRRLLDFCGLGWDDACLKPHEADRAIRTASRLQARQPVYASSIGRAERYRAYLGPLIAALDGSS